MVFNINRAVLLLSLLLIIQATCSQLENELKELNIRMDNMQVVLEKQQLRIWDYEEKNSQLEARSTVNEMRLKRLEEMLPKFDRLEIKTTENEAALGFLNLTLTIQLDKLKVKVENLMTKIGTVVESQVLTNSLIEENFNKQSEEISQLQKDSVKQEDAIIAIKTKHEAATTLTENVQEELGDRLDNMEVKIEHLTNKIDSRIESQEWKTSVLEEKWSKQEDEIIKINANCIRRISGNSQIKQNVPSSCKELEIKGHPFDGLYLVKNSDTKNIEAVLCNFDNTDISQVFIGNVDVKTKSVHFYVQRTSNYGFFGSIIPFEVARLNEGGAFNLASGIFTAPVAGIYSFQLSAVKNPTVAILWIYLQLNGVNVGIAGTSQGFTGSFGTVSLSSSLKLKADDRVNLFHAGGILFDNTERYTHFSGSLVKEDIA